MPRHTHAHTHRIRMDQLSMVYALSRLRWHFPFNDSSPIKVAEKYPPIKYCVESKRMKTLVLMNKQLLCKHNATKNKEEKKIPSNDIPI